VIQLRISAQIADGGFPNLGEQPKSLLWGWGWLSEPA